MQRSTIPSNQDSTILQGVISLVLSVFVHVKEIAQYGRLFPWKKPACCPCCQGGLWWHGFVHAYFSCCPDAVELPRLRCSKCGAVHRLRPVGYFPRFRSSIEEVESSIRLRTHGKIWRPDLPRSRQRQWWRRLWRMIKLMHGVSFAGNGIEGFQLLLEQEIIPVTSAKEKENMTVK